MLEAPAITRKKHIVLFWYISLHILYIPLEFRSYRKKCWNRNWQICCSDYTLGGGVPIIVMQNITESLSCIVIHFAS